MKCFKETEKKIKEYVKKKCGTKRKKKIVEIKEERRDKFGDEVGNQGNPDGGKYTYIMILSQLAPGGVLLIK